MTGRRLLLAACLSVAALAAGLVAVLGWLAGIAEDCR